MAKKKNNSKALTIWIVITIIYTTFILTNIYAQEDMMMSDFLNFMIPAIVPWVAYFVWKGFKK
jgi:hypothetical protein